MKLPRRFDYLITGLFLVAIVFAVACLMKIGSQKTYADTEGVYVESQANFVTFYDSGEKLTVRTEAKTVGEAIERANLVINTGDIVDPALDSEINMDNFFINIYRARPVVVKDGIYEKYLMSASFDAKTVVREAGLTVYDGDEIKVAPARDFLEVGAASVYELVRNGGRTVTMEEAIPFVEETVKDVNLMTGQSEVRQLGEVGLKRVYYNVLYVDNEEVSREIVKEEVVREPVPRVVAQGVKKSIPPEWGTCADWARQAGVSEADLSAALDLIYRESGCRVDAANASGAYGIPQALPGGKMASAGADWQTNPVTQIRWMIGYVNGRYGGWSQALSYWYAHGWY